MKSISEAQPASVYRIKTPDGDMFVVLAKDLKSKKPWHVEIHIGKNGGSLQAWANAVASLINLCLESDIPIVKVLETVTNQTSDRVVNLKNGVKITSGPGGVGHALLRMLQDGKKKNVDYRSLS